ncbi:WD40 repeat-like protein [Macroventuria anomochaeta]|uniref:WD40 repeat-like protein n=1 Tax=Macroventuria anomochaeta TaxID=301207 RepID=A0ACB6RQB6_9PLEO|nr:WD40 repeat-like protein [Macroventuria anomochaeta]KAF2623590.1 WD40 repeat-like protein [Macroventuria anomochaeta]
MCNLSKPRTRRSEINEEMVASSLPAKLQYACRYWVDHLEHSQRSVADGDAVLVFIQTHLLHWLEAMSLMRETGQCVRLLSRLQALVAPSGDAYLAFLRNANRFVLRFCSILAEAPLQVYSSALVFAPETSIFRKTFVKQVPQAVEMLSDREGDWDACRSVLEGHSDNVNAVVFSRDGQLVASASDDRTVRVWETATGTYDVNAVVFSRDGQLVASASDDETVRVWETVTGTCRSELKGHSQYVNAVVFSSDGQLVASASHDRTVRVWETATGTCRGVLDSSSPYIYHLTFSPDDQALHTDKGDIPLPASLNLTPPVEQEEQSLQLSVEDQWVLRNTQRFLWLLFKYRSYNSAVCKDMVCLRCPSGRVALLKLQ